MGYESCFYCSVIQFFAILVVRMLLRPFQNSALVVQSPGSLQSLRIEQACGTLPMLKLNKFRLVCVNAHLTCSHSSSLQKMQAPELNTPIDGGTVISIPPVPCNPETKGNFQAEERRRKDVIIETIFNRERKQFLWTIDWKHKS